MFSNPNNEAISFNFQAYQAGDLETSVNLSFELPEDFEASKSKICGTLLNELFRWVALQKRIRAKGLKLSQPILLKFTVGNIAFDTGRCSKQATQVLKLQNTVKGRSAYAKRFYDVFNYSVAPIQVVDYYELVSGLERILEAQG